MLISSAIFLAVKVGKGLALANTVRKVIVDEPVSPATVCNYANKMKDGMDKINDDDNEGVLDVVTDVIGALL